MTRPCSPEAPDLRAPHEIVSGLARLGQTNLAQRDSNPTIQELKKQRRAAASLALGTGAISGYHSFMLGLWGQESAYRITGLNEALSSDPQTGVALACAAIITSLFTYKTAVTSYKISRTD
jgi:hypothetical protein